MPTIKADTRNLTRSRDRLVNEARTIAARAAATGTQLAQARAAALRSRRPEGQPRRHRISAGLALLPAYQVTQDRTGIEVMVNKSYLDAKTATVGRNPYWLIQEVGTGNAGVLRWPRGEVTPYFVPSQTDREIPVGAGLGWATSDFTYVRPRRSRFRLDQIERIVGREQGLAERVSKAHARTFGGPTGYSRFPIVIGREIMPKRFVTNATRAAQAQFYAGMRAAIQRFG